MPPTKMPKIFISYSHDTPHHKKWVANLGIKLRHNGVDAVLDQWDLFPGEDIPVFMERQLSECDYALLVCTERYVEKANSGEGGVGYEKMIVSSQMVNKMDINKFIPIIRQAGTREVPLFIKSKLFLDFSTDDEFEIVFDELLRTIFRSSLRIKPPLGSPPVLNVGSVANQSKQDLPEHALKVLRNMVSLHDSSGHSSFSEVSLKSDDLGQVAVDDGLRILRSKEYVGCYDWEWHLTEEGKAFAVKCGLA